MGRLEGLLQAVERIAIGLQAVENPLVDCLLNGRSTAQDPSASISCLVPQYHPVEDITTYKLRRLLDCAAAGVEMAAVNPFRQRTLASWSAHWVVRALQSQARRERNSRAPTSAEPQS